MEPECVEIHHLNQVMTFRTFPAQVVKIGCKVKVLEEFEAFRMETSGYSGNQVGKFT